MMWAAVYGHKEIVAMLIDRGGGMDIQAKVRYVYLPPSHLS